MTPCKMRERCQAVLCPERPKTLRRKWRPSQPICRSKKYKGLPWIVEQREIAESAKKAYCLDELMGTKTIKTCN